MAEPTRDTGLLLAFETCLRNSEDLRFCLESNPGEQVQLAHGLEGLPELVNGAVPPNVFMDDSEFFMCSVFCRVVILPHSTIVELLVTVYILAILDDCKLVETYCELCSGGQKWNL